MRRRALPWFGACALLVSGAHAKVPDAKEPAVESSSNPSVSEGMAETPEFVPLFALRKSGRYIDSGLRLQRTGGALEVANELFPPGGELLGVPLPEHLGGGYLFAQRLLVSGASVTALYRSPSFTGKLEALARVPFSVGRIHPGFDRIYLLSSGVQIALDLETGEILPLHPLPPVPVLTGMSFSGANRGLIEAPIEGVLYTENSGLSWQRLPEAKKIEYAHSRGELYVGTDRGTRKVLAGARLVDPNSDVRFSNRPNHLLKGRSESKALSNGDTSGLDASARALSTMVTRGAKLGGSAFGIHEGRLLRFKGSDPLAFESFPTSISRTARCTGVSPARIKKTKEVLFVCQDQKSGKSRSPLRIYSVREDKEGRAKLRHIHEAGDARVLAMGQGGVLIEGSCSRAPAKSLEACLVTGRKSSSVRGALSESKGSAGKIALAVSHSRVSRVRFDPKKKYFEVRELLGKKQTTRKYKLPEDRAVVELVQYGDLLPQASLVDGGIALWSVRGEKFVGVRLGEGKIPGFGAIQRPLRRALFDGPRAVLWGAAGFAKQSTDGGLTFAELSYPYRSGQPELTLADNVSASIRMGCSSVGCVLGRFFRFGYSLREGATAELPSPTRLPPQGGTRLHFTCRAGPTSSAPRRSESVSKWPAFWESAPPESGHADGLSSVAFPHEQGRLYAHGPKDAAWGRQGNTQFRFVNPWRVKNVLESLPTAHLFSSHLEAQGVMGLLARASGQQHLALDPKGDAGVLLLRTRQSSELLTFHEGATLERFRNADKEGYRRLVSAAYAGGRFFAAFLKGSTVSVVRLEGGDFHPVLVLDLDEAKTRGPQLVRTERGDLGLSLPGDSGWFIYPIGDSGELGQAIVVPFPKQRAPACGQDASGFLLEREMTLAPYVESSDGRPLEVTGIRERLIVGAGGVCLDALSARTRANISAPAGASQAEEVEFTILSSDSTGRRSRLLCH